MGKRASFEWDDDKNLQNQRKHGVAFAEAQYAFADRDRVILRDHSHSDTVKITIALSKTSVDFFKRKAGDHRTQYQRMIRRLLDEYVQRQMQSSQR